MRYKHSAKIHNLNAPNQIVPLLMEIFHPKSVIDVGCGIGTFLSAFKSSGVKEVFGLDGSWTNKEMLSKHLNENEFQETDLEKPFTINRRFDIAICLEVAEHLSENMADILVENLTSVSDVIIFSAAVPFQGGQNHLNEQWIDYWQKKFNRKHYKIYDGLRQLLWDNELVESWYKQNIFIVGKSGLEIKINPQLFLNNKDILTYIHPDTYLIKATGYNNFHNGNLKPHIYLKLFIKSIFKKFNIEI